VTTLGELATTIRSKNAGPFWTTIDFVFADDDGFQMVMRSGIVSPARISAMYGVPAEDVVVTAIAHIQSIKVSFPRRLPQGDPADADMHSGQQYGPLVELEIDPQAGL
jgi:hypothetical protein